MAMLLSGFDNKDGAQRNGTPSSAVGTQPSLKQLEVASVGNPIIKADSGQVPDNSKPINYTPGVLEAHGNGVHAGMEAVAVAFDPNQGRDATGVAPTNAKLIAASWNACVAVNPANPIAAAEVIPALVNACTLLMEQYGAVTEFTMGGKLTNEPFLLIEAALKQMQGVR